MEKLPFKIDIYAGVNHCGNCTYFVPLCLHCGCGVCTETNTDMPKVECCDKWRGK